MDIMQSGIDRDLTLSRIAHSVSLTPEHLCRLFKAETGNSPMSYLKLQRIELAQSLLTTTFLTLKEIMLRVGASDQSHFMRDFKSACGMTPSDYRRSRTVERNPHLPEIKSRHQLSISANR